MRGYRNGTNHEILGFPVIGLWKQQLLYLQLWYFECKFQHHIFVVVNAHSPVVVQHDNTDQRCGKVDVPYRRGSGNGLWRILSGRKFRI